LLRRRELPRGAFVLEMERAGLEFSAGEHILLGVVADIERREYSIYSAEEEDRLAVLIKRVEQGMVSARLARAPIGSELALEGPLGYFVIPEAERYSREHIFIATGSGIAPYHSFAKSYRGLHYRLIHGTRYSDESYDRDCYARERYTHCVSREDSGDVRGRVTDYLRATPIDSSARYYLCGNCDMIYEVFDILQQGGVAVEQISAEVYF